MAKRIASQVHQQVGRLLRENYLKKEPAWYQAVLEHPPLPLPSKAPPSRTNYDLPADGPSLHSATSKRSTAYNPRPLPIHYVEDELRRQFFTDHPFEAFRATTLVESGGIEPEHPIRGAAWTRLSQRGRNPTPEDAIRFALNLYEYHNTPLSNAYAAAVAQFRSLRSEQELAQKYALREAEWYGIKFGLSQVEIHFNKEEKVLASWSRHNTNLDAYNAARKKWKAVVQRDGPEVPWSGGQEYVRLWKEGVRPDYTPIMTQSPTSAQSSQADEVQSRRRDADFMKVGAKAPEVVKA